MVLSLLLCSKTRAFVLYSSPENANSMSKRRTHDYRELGFGRRNCLNGAGHSFFLESG